MTKYFWLCFTAGLLLTSYSWCQKFDVKDFDKYKAKYPEEQAIFLQYHKDVDIRISGDSLIATSTITKNILHLGDKSTVFAKDVIYSSSFNETTSIEAKTLIPEKKKYRAIEVLEFKETYDKSSSVFYDDTKSTNFFFPAVQQGAITSLSYTQAFSEPKFLGTHVFQSYLPIESAQYSLTVDNGINLKMDILNDTTGLIKKESSSDSKRTTYLFTMPNATKLQFDDNAPSIPYTVPHVVTIISSYEVNGKKVNMLSSPDDLYAWYSTFIDGLKEADYDNIKEILSGIINEEDSELEKVRKLFYWVQDNIKYIAFEDGMRGLIPHNASYVCDKRYGDCKDMASILVNMLTAAGIEAYFTWIGTRDIPYNYSDYPSPIVDNHMIATYIDGDNYYFLDATSQYSSVEMPSSMTQGKEALIALGEGNYEIKKVPVIEGSINLRSDSSTFYLEDGKVVGSGIMRIYGYPKVFNTFRLIKSSKTGVDKYLTKLLGRGSNKFFIDDYTINNLEDRDHPIEIAYNFRVEDYYRQIGNKIYFNINLDKEFGNTLIEAERKMPIEKEFKFKRQLVSVLAIPEGYKVNRIPEDVVHQNGLQSFNLKYTVSDDKIILTKTITSDQLMINPEKFEEWNEGIKTLSKAYRAVIILEKNES